MLKLGPGSGEIPPPMAIFLNLNLNPNPSLLWRLLPLSCSTTTRTLASKKQMTLTALPFKPEHALDSQPAHLVQASAGERKWLCFALGLGSGNKDRLAGRGSLAALIAALRMLTPGPSCAAAALPGDARPFRPMPAAFKCSNHRCLLCSAAGWVLLSTGMSRLSEELERVVRNQREGRNVVRQSNAVPTHWCSLPRGGGEEKPH